MIEIKIKPLSVNEAWKGRRFKTGKYKQFEKDLLSLLPKKYIIPDGKLKIFFIWGFSSKASDWDNPIKTMQDVLQKKYNFNDNRIYDAHVKKIDVKKGNEFIKFKIEEIKN